MAKYSRHKTRLNLLGGFIYWFLLPYPGICSFLQSPPVTIGNNEWAPENLNVTKFSNGDPILHAQSDDEWINASRNRTPSDAISLKKEEEAASVQRGKELFNEIGCSGCHSPYTKTMGMYGPPLGKIFGVLRQFEDGSSLKVDEEYLRESIIAPSKKVVKGYNSQMPSYLGILSDTDIESLLLYISKL